MDRTHARAPGRLQAFLLASAMSLFLGALIGDYAYWSSHELQWSNFASWLLAGGMVFLGIALVLALLGLVRKRRHDGFPWGYFVLLLAAFVLAVINVLVHARDAWAVMPAGLVLSAILTVLVAAATWLAHSRLSPSRRVGELP